MSIARRFWSLLRRRPAPRFVVALWLAARWDAIVAPGAEILYPSRLRRGRGARLGRCGIICTGDVSIGEDAIIHDGAVLDAQSGPIALGARSTVNPYCVLYGAGGLEIGSDVGIAAHTVIIPSNHAIDDTSRPMMSQAPIMKGVHIADDVWIAAHVTILDGVHIGKGAVIGAGAVVNRDVGELEIAAGVPVRTIRRRDGRRAGEAELAALQETER